MLELQDYRQIINLDQPRIQEQKQELLSPTEQEKLTRELLTRFTGQTSAANQQVDAKQARRALYALQIQAPPFHFKQSELKAIDQLLPSEQHACTVHAINTRAKPNAGTQPMLWRGDITTLACDAIVNAANSASTEIKCDGGARFKITSYNQTMAQFENGQSRSFSEGKSLPKKRKRK